MGIIVAIDFETTRIDPSEGRIIEVGAVAFERDGREVGVFDERIRPDRPVSPSSYRVHGISDEMLSGCLPRLSVLGTFLDWLDWMAPSKILAHNATFEGSFLGRELERSGLPVPGFDITCTLHQARTCLPWLGSHRLSFVAAACGVPISDRHRALADARLVKGIWGIIGHKYPQVSVKVWGCGIR